MTPTEAATAQARGELLLVDVREPEERERTPLAGTEALPWSALERGAPWPWTRTTRPSALFCATGRRARLAAEHLASRGHDAACVDGALDALATALGIATDESTRYTRQLALRGWGPAAQARLRDARVLVVGVGGLGTPAALYLAAAGVGTLGLVDHDAVALSNLHRQVLFADADVGRAKVDVAARALLARTPTLRTERFARRFDPSILDAGWDVILDALDDEAPRYVLNDAACDAGVPLVHGAVHGWEGRVTTFPGRGGPCLRCAFPIDPESALDANACARVGILGAIAGTVGALQATEALKVVVGAGESLAGRFVLYDARTMTFRTQRFAAAPSCRCQRGAAPR